MVFAVKRREKRKRKKEIRARHEVRQFVPAIGFPQYLGKFTVHAGTSLWCSFAINPISEFRERKSK